MREVRHWHRLPRRLRMPQPWPCSKPGWEILEHPGLVRLSLEMAVGTSDFKVHSNSLALYDSIIFSYQTRNRREIK